MKRLGPRAWRDLFPANFSAAEDVGWLTLPGANDPAVAGDLTATGGLWQQLARAADPKFERPRARQPVEIETLDQNRGVILSQAASGTR